MKCKIDGCGRESMYKEKQLCQMHYFRIMRNGNTDLKVITRKYRSQNPAGYQRLFEPTHALANVDGYVYEHRFIVFNKYGHDLPDCEICGKPTDWSTCHIDHKDEDVTNNNIDNIRPVCRGCNTGRTERSTIKKFDFMGDKYSVTELSKIKGVTVGRHMLKMRLDRGMTVKDALFTPNLTHP